MSRTRLPKIEVRAVAWTDVEPLKYQSFLSYNGLRLISDPMPSPEEALDNMLELLKNQQEFVHLAIENWDAISSVKLPLKKTGNGKGTSLIDFV